MSLTGYGKSPRSVRSLHQAAAGTTSRPISIPPKFPINDIGAIHDSPLLPVIGVKPTLFTNPMSVDSRRNKNSGPMGFPYRGTSNDEIAPRTRQSRRRCILPCGPAIRKRSRPRLEEMRGGSRPNRPLRSRGSGDKWGSRRPIGHWPSHRSTAPAPLPRSRPHPALHRVEPVLRSPSRRCPEALDRLIEIGETKNDHGIVAALLNESVHVLHVHNSSGEECTESGAAPRPVVDSQPHIRLATLNPCCFMLLGLVVVVTMSRRMRFGVSASESARMSPGFRQIRVTSEAFPLVLQKNRNMFSRISGPFRPS